MLNLLLILLNLTLGILYYSKIFEFFKIWKFCPFCFENINFISDVMKFCFVKEKIVFFCFFFLLFWLWKKNIGSSFFLFTYNNLFWNKIARSYLLLLLYPPYFLIISGILFFFISFSNWMLFNGLLFAYFAQNKKLLFLYFIGFWFNPFIFEVACLCIFVFEGFP